MLFIGIAFVGIYSFSKLGIDLLPNLTLPHLVVHTTYQNSTPEEIEKLVTEPLESAIGTVTGVKKINSISKESISVISIDFLWGTNMDMAVLSLREKLDNIRFALPKDTGRPTIIRADPSSEPVLSLALTYRLKLKEDRWKASKNGSHVSESAIRYVDHDSPEYDIKRLIDLKEAARVIFRRRFEQLEGVAQTIVTGGLEREILVEVNPQKLTSYNISFNDIESALKSANINMPAGSIMNGLFRYSLRTLGEYDNINEIKKTLISYKNNRAILLSDIADVKDNFKERDGLTRLDGSETVGLLIYKESGSNTVSISKTIKETIKTLEKEYPEFKLIVVSDQSGFIENAIANVKQEILYGGILAVFVLFFFLGNLRNVFIIGITIPASLVLTILLMYLFQINFNIISLGGIAVGVGMLLDNAIIVIENVVRYREEGLSIHQAALKGSSEVSMPIVAATLTTIAVFLPLIFVKGIAGELFKDQSYAIAFSLTSSIIVALTLIPMLASRKKYFSLNKDQRKEFILIEKGNRSNIFISIIYWIKFPFQLIIKTIQLILLNVFIYLSERLSFYFNKFYKICNRWLDKLIVKYEILLEWSLNNKKLVLSITAFLLFITILAGIDIKKEFIPAYEQDEFIVELIYPKGTSLKGNAYLTSEIEEKILNIPQVKNIVSNIGRVNEFDFINKEQQSVNKSNLIVKLDSYKSFYKVISILKQVFKNIGITKYSFKHIKTTYSEIIQPSEYDIEIKIKNKDLDIAYSTANELTESLNNNKIEGVTNIRMGDNKGISEYNLTIDEKRCNVYGLTTDEVSNRICYLVKGNEATLFSDFDKKIAINIKTKSKARDDISKILSQYIIKGNTSIQIKELVDVNLKNSFSQIRREDQSRTIFIYADINNISVDDAVDKLQKQIGKLPKIKDQTIIIGGANEELHSSFSQLFIALLISIFLMYMVLTMEFESFLFPFIIIIAVPLGLIGGILSLYILGESISIISIMGLIILVGIADNDAVVKVEFIIRKRKEGLNIHDAILQAGKERFRPIVMNSMTVIFALIPMIIGVGAGTQLRISLSLAVAGGLFSATFLTLIVIPVLYTYLERWSKKRILN
ncbi:MAG: efflux RND transporter permease subunit [Ignavibacteriae bacterium]|nr:efflux RND transporter permease subunit [Ignavibacteriota bacterium]